MMVGPCDKDAPGKIGDTSTYSKPIGKWPRGWPSTSWQTWFGLVLMLSLQTYQRLLKTVKHFTKSHGLLSTDPYKKSKY